MTENLATVMQKSSYLSGGNAEYIEGLYEIYLKDPNAVTAEWRTYFQNLPKVNGMDTDASHSDIQSYFRELSQHPRVQVGVSTDILTEKKQAAVERLINAFRTYGHLAANIDPLERGRPGAPELELSYHELSDADLATSFRAQDVTGKAQSKLQEIYQSLRKTYCASIGFEYMYMRNQTEVQWLQQHIEAVQGRAILTNEEKLQLLKLLTAADGLEKYLGAKYVGQKRFSLEGGDSLTPLIHESIQRGGAKGIEEVVICMAHRGRLNVLVNILGQSPEELFQEFEGKKEYGMTTGDVKYHLGFASNIKTKNGPLHLSLMFNPSHLEFINAVAMGSVRARQHRRADLDKKQVMSIAVHGDASFAGQGIVMETLNMSQTRGYGIGGTLHVIVNNQIGFTTSKPEDARSSEYCSDLAKMIDAPVFHVNGNDPEAVIYATQLAVDYYLTFHKDVVINLVCYRLHGHNEADEPTATQPLMYQKIKQLPPCRLVYGKQLVTQQICSEEHIEILLQEYRSKLDQGHRVVEILPAGEIRKNAANWTPYIGQDCNVAVDTGVDKKRLTALAEKLEQLPEGFTLQRQVGLVMEARKKMTRGELPLDWGYAENLAYATLVDESYSVRMSGQDCRRGTFAHRHATVHDFKTGACYTPLKKIGKHGQDFEIYDSLLSESGVLGFEYGYATAYPNALVIWEAQFGDFANGAQVIIDQFISSGWQKWQRLCGLTLFLPHGQEGMGPEHSSARLGRFLQLSAQHNMQVCVPTTPAQAFHMLRRQVLRPFRKPLVVMTPKSLLRHKLAASSLADLETGKFQLVIPEIDAIDLKDVRRVILCCGKVYYDLLARRREKKQKDVAILRVEQLYPFPYDELKAELERYHNTKDIVWCQEEPRNQGAWYPSRHDMEECLQKGQQIKYVGRNSFAAPAPGYPALHRKLQGELVEKALEI